MSPQTKKLLMIGIPIGLGILTLVLTMHHSSSSTPTTTASGAQLITTAGELQASENTLATYESYTEQQISALTQRIKTALQGETSGPLPTWTPGGQVNHAGPPGPAPGGPSTTTLGGATWYVLGGFQTTGAYKGLNVSGTKEVAFTWTGHGTPTVGPPPAGATGVVAYTPVTTPTSDIGNPSDNVPSWSRGYT